MKIVASGDWHLDWYTGGVPRYSDVRACARVVVERAKHADLFAFLGDLSDPDTDGALAAIDFAAEVASELAVEGVPSFWVNGNHDVDGAGSSVLAPLAGVQRGGATKDLIRVFDRPAAFGFKSVGVIVLPYPRSSAPYDPCDFIERLEPLPERVPVVVFGHLWIEGMAGGSESTDLARGGSVYWPTEAIEKAFGGRALMVGGHYHEAGNCRGVHLAGSLARLTFGEANLKPGFLELELGT